MSFTQRRGFLRSGELDAKEIYAELDYIHQVLNALSFPLGERVFLDHSADVFSRRIYCMRPGLTIRLPVLKKEDDGWVIFIQDRSGEAATSNITITAPAGKLINASATSSITSAYGKKLIQWDFEEGKYFEIL